MEWWKRGRWVLAYGLFYLFAFYLIEHRPVETNLIYMEMDEEIPFCEYFIIPYVLWYFFVLATLIYFVFFNQSRQEFLGLAVNLGIGMTVFIVISCMYPNGQNLRPEITGNNIFEQAVRFLYRIDTPTNIFPSIHVFNSIACCIALMKNQACRRKKVLSAGIVILTILIILSTMFLKQHSAWDVIGAVVMSGVLYPIAYPGQIRVVRRVKGMT